MNFRLTKAVIDSLIAQPKTGNPNIDVWNMLQTIYEVGDLITDIQACIEAGIAGKTGKSDRNAKTALPGTYTTLKKENKILCHGTCSRKCPFYNEKANETAKDSNGCYADYYHTRMHWINANDDFMSYMNGIASLPRGSMLRLNVAGDMVLEAGELYKPLVNCFSFYTKQLNAYNYTHADYNKRNREIMSGVSFTNNWSCEAKSKAIEIAKNRDFAVLAVKSIKKGFTEEGVSFIKCPAQIKPDKDGIIRIEGKEILHPDGTPAQNNITCSTCKLCWKRNPGTVICFEAHGVGKKKAIEKGNLKDF